VAGLADLLWWISDRLGDVGPLDRAAFGWVVVIPVWIAAPVAAGFAWRTIDRRTTGAIAALVGTVVAVVGSPAVAVHCFPVMRDGSDPYPAGEGAAFPARRGNDRSGVALSGLVSARFARQARAIVALVLGAAAEALMVMAAILVAALILLGPSCQRPSV
jgi:hypothetical protein